MVHVDSVPQGASVYDQMYTPGTGSGYLGRTPFSVQVSSTRSHELYFVLTGYGTVKVRVELGRRDLLVRLDPADPLTWVTHHYRHHPGTSRLVAAGMATCAVLLGIWLRTRVRRAHEQMARTEAGAEASKTETIGDYRILETLGDGAFSRVYRVAHAEHGDEYALKWLKKECVNAEAMSRFFREMGIGRDLRHPNLVRVFAFGECEGAPYLLMECLSGQTLRERLQEGPLRPGEAIDVAIQVCNALACCHEHDVIHRDVKPGNIMLLADGTVRVLDFGIARCVDRRRLTSTGAPMGTPQYMSPEHARSRVDARSDLYSLGVVLFEMLSGTVPFSGTDAISVIMAHVSTAAPSLRSMAPDLPPAVDALVARMLEKDPARRPQSADEVRAALVSCRELLA